MKHLKKLLALALVAVSLFAVALPTMALAGSASNTSTLTSGNETDMGKCLNVGPFTAMTGNTTATGNTSGAYTVRIRYTNAAGTIKNGTFGAVTGYVNGGKVAWNDTVQSGDKGYDIWFRLNPNGQQMKVAWVLAWS